MITLWNKKLFPSCIRFFLYMYTYIYIHILRRICIYTLICIHTYIDTYIYTYIYVFIYKQNVDGVKWSLSGTKKFSLTASDSSYICIYIYIHIYIHIYIYISTHSYVKKILMVLDDHLLIPTNNFRIVAYESSYI
jgi:hypothetical protein